MFSVARITGVANLPTQGMILLEGNGLSSLNSSPQKYIQGMLLESDPGPREYEADALPLCHPHILLILFLTITSSCYMQKKKKKQGCEPLLAAASDGGPKRNIRKDFQDHSTKPYIHSRWFFYQYKCSERSLLISFQFNGFFGWLFRKITRPLAFSSNSQNDPSSMNNIVNGHVLLCFTIFNKLSKLFLEIV